MGREALHNGEGLFKYKGMVDVPALAMIDNVLGMSRCGEEFIELNVIINAKMESKKLRLSKENCFKIHICKGTIECFQILKVHEKNMKNVSQAKYLGDLIS